MKLMEIKAVKKEISAESVAWLKKFTKMYADDLTWWINQWKRDSDAARRQVLRFDGKGSKMEWPAEIEFVKDLELEKFVIDNFSGFPDVEGLELVNCEIGSGLVEYLREKDVAECRFYGTKKLSMEDAIEFVSLPTNNLYEVWMYAETDGEDARLTLHGDDGHIRMRYLNDQTGKRIEKSFTDVFDLQEQLLELPGVEKYFK